MVSKVLSKSTLIVWIWVYAISISTIKTKAMVDTQHKDKSTHHSSKTNEIEEEPLLSAHEHIKPDETTRTLPHFYGEKILLATKAVNRLIWYGPDEEFLRVIEDFKKIKNKNGWNLSKWFKSTKHDDWHQQLLKIFDLSERFSEQNRRKRKRQLEG